MHRWTACRASVVAAAVLGMAGSALAAGPAQASQLDYGTNGVNGAVPVGTTYTATNGTTPFKLVTSSGFAAVTCTSSTLSGVTTGSGGISTGLNVQASSVSSCSGAVTSVVPSYPWQLGLGTPTSVSLTVRCGSNSETFAGSLTTAWTNVVGASTFGFNGGQYLSETAHTGAGCGLPGPYAVTAKYTLATTGGSPVTAGTNFWLM